MDKFSYVGNGDVGAVNAVYEQFQANPDSVDASWKEFFQGFEFALEQYDEGASAQSVEKEFKVFQLIEGYRTRGHLFTKTNPVRARRPYTDTISAEYYGFTAQDMDTVFHAGNKLGLGAVKLKEIVSFLEDTYCRSIGVEYVYNRKPEQLEWIIERIEKNRNTPSYNSEQKIRMFTKLSEAVEFEAFVHKKFVGQKRFSLEGGESLIPAIYALVERGSELGVKEMVIGMAHRGRLNILANIFKKPAESIFTEFEGKGYDSEEFDGDVKYHLGSTHSITTNKGANMHLTLAPNPSHLEAVGPVVEGITRAKIDNILASEQEALPVIIHGDASVSGQGVVYEVVQMAQLSGYKTGGTIHIVVNNQIGFTTNYIDGRSSTYSTDIGKVTLCPVFHVNGDDVEAVVHVMEIAMEFRQRYKKDVFIDLLGYRKYGHNEGDEPRFTQPLLYKAIATHLNPKELYAQTLLAEGVITPEKIAEIKAVSETYFNAGFEKAKNAEHAQITDFMQEYWENYPVGSKAALLEKVDTTIPEKELVRLATQICTLPSDKKIFRKIQKLFQSRMKMVEDDKLDWAMGELLAYASLLASDKQHNVRLSGQDVERGTFSHRHSVVTEEDSENKYIPLNNIQKKQGEFTVYNSFLSEYAVLGFDYGYAMASPNTLTLWEAQFGDFANGAQIIFDQFLSAAEDKWKTMNGLVILLPHGYEGQGAEHSSGRMERFLQLTAEGNFAVANVTSPANYFHLLRRQMVREFRKPLVVFTPKSLLRHPLCVSPKEDFVTGGFQDVIADTINPKKVKRVVFVNGKLYYELLQKRQELGREDVALVRIEQLYPLNFKKIDAILEGYKGAELVWAQEEPENMGAWSFILRKMYTYQPRVIARKPSGSPASGSSQVAAERQKRIIDQVFEKI
ncbi:MAG: 2-oxoglutarate dehydrogenase E1 component [Salibacteraceae bacterium]|jgi:2-oxoglutarate dehydrogenase E1 component